MKSIAGYVPGELRAVPPQLYGDMVANARAAGASERDAEDLVDAALGPLNLVPPPPDIPYWQWEDMVPSKSAEDFCLAAYFTYQGEWKWCGEKPEHGDRHFSFHGKEHDWVDGDARAIPREYR
ncbi:hypothetical protein [Streptomyces sp. NPDC017448]|uniref:hypothetical protein n=1 Tax=Streptomyces sp. NPDC017448 TaxID=3364996 RepID=UPI00379E7929